MGVGPATERIKAHMGFKRFSTHVPGVIAAGTFHQDGRTVFWDVHHPDKAIALELRDERFDRLVVEVEDQDNDLTTLERALGAAAVPAGSPGTDHGSGEVVA